MLLRIALLNMSKRLSQSALTLVAMTLAAATLISGMSQAQGRPAGADLGYRNYYGADILVFSPGHIGSYPELNLLSELEHKTMRDSGFNPITLLYPDLLTEGYLAPVDWSYAPIAEQDVNLLKSFPGVRNVTPYLGLPAYLKGQTVLIKPSSLVGIELEGELPTVGAQIEITVNAYRSVECELGDRMELVMPQYGVDNTGLPYINSLAPTTSLPVVVVGKVKQPTRELSVTTEGGVITEQGYVHASEVFVEPSVWQSLWQTHSSGSRYPVLAARLTIENMGAINTVAAGLQKEIPHLSVMTIGEIARHVEEHNLLDWFYRVPRAFWLRTYGELHAPIRSADFGTINKIMLYVVCGMLMASQMFLRVTERRREVGTLKTLGLMRYELIIVMMLEAWLLSAAGATVGAFTMSIFTFFQHLTNGIGALAALIICLKEISLVIFATTAAVLVFGAVPTLVASNQTVMEAFRR